MKKNSDSIKQLVPNMVYTLLLCLLSFIRESEASDIEGYL